MNSTSQPAIARLVAHYGGPTNIAKLAGKVPYQHFQQWVARGWASPLHYGVLLPLLPDAGLTVIDLIADRDHAKASAKPAAITAAGKVKKQRAGAQASNAQPDRREARDDRRQCEGGFVAFLNGERREAPRRASEKAQG